MKIAGSKVWVLWKCAFPCDSAHVFGWVWFILEFFGGIRVSSPHQKFWLVLGDLLEFDAECRAMVGWSGKAFDFYSLVLVLLLITLWFCHSELLQILPRLEQSVLLNCTSI